MGKPRSALGMVLSALLAIATHLAAPCARAVQPDEVLSDPVRETRARRLSAELRCLVCQNQSIDDSNAPLARDLRLLVRERIVAGDSDADAMRYIVARYGEYVLLRPPVGPHTALLWGTPLLVLGLAVYILWRRKWPLSPEASGRRSASATALTAEEETRLVALLGRPDERGAGPPPR